MITDRIGKSLSTLPYARMVNIDYARRGSFENAEVNGLHAAPACRDAQS
jgi:hypothetical protein